MTQGLYHINPETGNPNRCRAKVQCPYRALHYGSAEEARDAYEQSYSGSALGAIRFRKLSAGAKLLTRLSANAKILDSAVKAYRAAGAEARDSEAYRESKLAMDSAIKVRDTLTAKLKALPWDEKDAPVFNDDERVAFQPLTFGPTEARQGLDGQLFTTDPRSLQMLSQLDRASAVWVQRLSTAEVKALVLYNGDARLYAIRMAGESLGSNEHLDDEFVANLHSALAKAPLAEQPYTAYSGISHERAAEINVMAKTGTIDLNRVQSASANPAMINSFIAPSDWKAEQRDETVLELKLDRVASLSAFNINRKEMELLAPPGRYRVESSLHGLPYYWGGLKKQEKNVGKTADNIYLISRVNGESHGMA